MTAMPELNAIVSQCDRLTPRLMIMRVEPDGWELPHFEPGQYIVLGLPPTAERCALSAEDPVPPKPGRMIRRAYSIASSSASGEYMDFYVRLVSTGALTPRLFALDVGDRLWLSDHPVGMFTLADVAVDHDIILIATGTGLAPYMSMLASQLECGASRRFIVLHGADHSWDLGYRSELDALQHLCNNLTYVPTLALAEQEPVPWRGRSGWVQDLWSEGVVKEIWGEPPDPVTTDVFLCGVKGMLDDMLPLLIADGFVERTRHQPGQIHLERF